MIELCNMSFTLNGKKYTIVAPGNTDIDKLTIEIQNRLPGVEINEVITTTIEE